MKFREFLRELHRRAVWKVAVAYTATAVVLLEAFTHLFHNFEAPHWVLKVITTLLIAGLPLACLAAWGFEVKEGRLRSVPREPRESKPALPAPATTAPPSIAVLPFEDMSPEQDQKYLGHGIAEELLNALVAIEQLKVAARTSSFALADRGASMQEIGDTLHVRHVLEGSVRRSGQKLRVTAQLIDVESGFHLYSQAYDRAAEDLFDIQNDIAREITRALLPRIGLDPAATLVTQGTRSHEAYNLYLMARQYSVRSNDWATRSAEAMVRLCKRATEIDPDYAQAWSLLANGLATLRFGVGRPGDDGLIAAERALALNPDLAEAHATKAKILTELGRTDDASREIEIALRLDPESYEVHRCAGKLRYRQRRFEDAIRHYRKAMALIDTDVYAAGMLVSSYLAIGDETAARETARVVVARAERAIAADQNDAGSLAGGAYSLALLGEVDRAKAWISRAVLIDPDNVTTRYNFVCSLSAHLHDVEAALDMLESLLPLMSAAFVRYAMVDPDLDPLRDHPRFKSMIAKADVRDAAGTTP